MLPVSLVNYLARLGWSHDDDEIFDRAELVRWFDVSHVNPAPARFDADKLRWLNHEHIKRLTEADLGLRLAPYLQRSGLEVAAGPDPVAGGAPLRDRAATLADMADAAHY